jgi:hypothetical protein
MVTDIDGLMECIAQGFIPERGDQLRQILETLPEMVTELAKQLGELSEFVGGEGPGERTSACIGDMAGHLGIVAESATEAFLEFQDEFSFWMDTG